MRNLVITALKQKGIIDETKTFNGILRSGVGAGYPIWKKYIEECPLGCKVVLLSMVERRRAEGILVKLVPGATIEGGLRLYDVHIENLTEVEFKPEAINRFGVGATARIVSPDAAEEAQSVPVPSVLEPSS